MKKLDQINKKLPYEAPEGYFDDFAMRIQKRVAQGESAKAPSWISTTVWKWAATPALLIALAILAYFYIPNGQEDGLAQTETDHREIVADISIDHLTEYLAEDADWHKAELYEITQSDADIQLPNSEEVLEEELLKSMDMQELEDYL